jgi:hypothetical protein
MHLAEFIASAPLTDSTIAKSRSVKRPCHYYKMYNQLSHSMQHLDKTRFAAASNLLLAPYIDCSCVHIEHSLSKVANIDCLMLTDQYG